MRRFGVRFVRVRCRFIGVGRVVFQRPGFLAAWGVRLLGIRNCAESIESLRTILSGAFGRAAVRGGIALIPSALSGGGPVWRRQLGVSFVQVVILRFRSGAGLRATRGAGLC